MKLFLTTLANLIIIFLSSNVISNKLIVNNLVKSIYVISDYFSSMNQNSTFFKTKTYDFNRIPIFDLDNVAKIWSDVIKIYKNISINKIAFTN